MPFLSLLLTAAALVAAAQTPEQQPFAWSESAEQTTRTRSSISSLINLPITLAGDKGNEVVTMPAGMPVSEAVDNLIRMVPSLDPAAVEEQLVSLIRRNEARTLGAFPVNLDGQQRFVVLMQGETVLQAVQRLAAEAKLDALIDYDGLLRVLHNVARVKFTNATDGYPLANRERTVAYQRVIIDGTPYWIRVIEGESAEEAALGFLLRTGLVNTLSYETIMALLLRLRDSVRSAKPNVYISTEQMYADEAALPREVRIPLKAVVGGEPKEYNITISEQARYTENAITAAQRLLSQLGRPSEAAEVNRVARELQLRALLSFANRNILPITPFQLKPTMTFGSTAVEVDLPAGSRFDDAAIRFCRENADTVLFATPAGAVTKLGDLPNCAQQVISKFHEHFVTVLQASTPADLDLDVTA